MRGAGGGAHADACMHAGEPLADSLGLLWPLSCLPTVHAGQAAPAPGPIPPTPNAAGPSSLAGPSAAADSSTAASPDGPGAAAAAAGAGAAAAAAEHGEDKEERQLDIRDDIFEMVDPAGWTHEHADPAGLRHVPHTAAGGPCVRASTRVHGLCSAGATKRASGASG